MDFLSVFKKQPEKLSIDEIAKMLEKDPEAVKAFEKEYKKQVLDINGGNGIFGPDAKSASKRDVSGNSALVSSDLQKIKNDIVLEFLSRTYLIRIINGCVSERLPDCPVDLVNKEQLMQIPKDIRPQCSGSLAIRDMPDEAEDLVLWNLKCYFDEQDIKKKKTYYAMFRQGLDSMDLGRYMWAMLSVAPMSMSNWIIPLAESVRNTENSIFKIPNTTVVRVPLCLLQMSRMDYEILNQTTRDIINDYCIKAFQLDTKKQYFIKTGVYSSKFDFRNAKVTDPDEIRQIGEYLTFISNQACQHTFPLNGISYYGAATTADWVVREFIPDKENNLTIYNGLPLRTEYRVFIDCDQDSVIGISPYWEPEVMKNHGEYSGLCVGAHHRFIHLVIALVKQIGNILSGFDF